jgi:hypothetical protein
MSWNRRSFFQRLAVMLSHAGTAGGQRRKGPQQPASAPSARPQAGGYIRDGTQEVRPGGGGRRNLRNLRGCERRAQRCEDRARSRALHAGGGNSSSDVRLFPEDTAHHSTWVKESGIRRGHTTARSSAGSGKGAGKHLCRRAAHDPGRSGNGGAKVVLVQDRSWLGGNSSSEVKTKGDGSVSVSPKAGRRYDVKFTGWTTRIAFQAKEK